MKWDISRLESNKHRPGHKVPSEKQKSQHLTANTLDGDLYHFQEFLDFRLRIVEMRRNTNVILARTVGSERSIYFGIQKFLVQSSQIGARSVK